MEFLIAAQMRAIEQAAIDSGEVTGLELMERAGQGVVDAIFEWRPCLTERPHRALVLCGPGNNGGDGFVVARLLKKLGWSVTGYFYGKEANLPPDAATNFQRWRDADGTTLPLTTETLDDATLRGRGEDIVIIDALFGTGLKRSCDDVIKSVESMTDMAGNASCWPEWYMVSVDIASGICADSGRLLGTLAFEPDLTVTFHRLKLGHVLADGPSWMGEVKCVDIGL